MSYAAIAALSPRGKRVYFCDERAPLHAPDMPVFGAAYDVRVEFEYLLRNGKKHRYEDTVFLRIWFRSQSALSQVWCIVYDDGRFRVNSREHDPRKPLLLLLEWDQIAAGQYNPAKSNASMPAWANRNQKAFLTRINSGGN